MRNACRTAGTIGENNDINTFEAGKPDESTGDAKLMDENDSPKP